MSSFTSSPGARHEYFLERYRDRVALNPDQPGIEIEGFVADVRPAYERAAVVVAPLVASAGTNIKILEAMAMGKAIVSTPAGVNGLDLSAGEDFILAQTPRKWRRLSKCCWPIRGSGSASAPRRATAYSANSAGMKSRAVRRSFTASLWVDLRGELIESHGAEERLLLRLGHKLHPAGLVFPKSHGHFDIQNRQ